MIYNTVYKKLKTIKDSIGSSSRSSFNKAISQRILDIYGKENRSQNQKVLHQSTNFFVHEDISPVHLNVEIYIEIHVEINIQIDIKVDMEIDIDIDINIKIGIKIGIQIDIEINIEIDIVIDIKIDIEIDTYVKIVNRLGEK